MKTFLMASAAALIGTAALAQPAPVPAPQARPMSDGVMTRAEVVETLRSHFAQMDTDRDGAITTAEVTARHGAMAGHGAPGAPHIVVHERRVGDPAHADHAPGAPRIVMHERRMGDPNAAFDRLDANKDGAISRDEFAKGREIRIEKRIEKRKDRREARRDGRREMRVHRMGGMGMGPMGGARIMVLADTNKDGRITLAEAEAMTLQHFDSMDKNRDGQVTREERRDGRRVFIQKMRAPTAG